MDKLYRELVIAVEMLKKGDFKEIDLAFDIISSVLKLNLPVPHEIIRTIFVRACAAAKTKNCSVKNLKFIEEIVNSSFSGAVFDVSDEGKMICTVFLSAIVANIEKSDAEFRRISWSLAENNLKRINYEVLKACFPGILKIIVEEVKKMRCQGLGSSRINTECSLSSLSYLMDILQDGSEWSSNALPKIIPVLDTISSELLEISKENLLQNKLKILEIFNKIYHYDVKLKNNIISEIIKLCAELNKSLEFQVDEFVLESIFIGKLQNLALMEPSQKNSALDIINFCLSNLGEKVVLIYSVNVKIILNVLFAVTKFAKLEYSQLKLHNLFEFTDKNSSVFEKFSKFVNLVMKHEVFDCVLTEQQNLMRKIRKNREIEDIEKLLKISFLFCDVYPESSLYVLTEIVFINIDITLQLITKLLFLFMTQKLYLDKTLSVPETLENILYIYSKDTEPHCNLLFSILCERENVKPASDLIKLHKNTLKNTMLLKLKIIDPESIFPTLNTFLSFYSDYDLICEIVHQSLLIFDKNLQSYSSQKIMNFLIFFTQLVQHFYAYEKKSATRIPSGNVVRKMLMRTKMFITLKTSELHNRKIIVQSLVLFKESFELLNGVPFEIDPLDHSEFAFEEEANVAIPNALPELCYEYFGSLLFCLKTIADSNCAGITLELLKIFQKISEFCPDFFETEKKFSAKIFPYLKIMLKSKNSNVFHTKINTSILLFLNSLSQQCLKPVKTDLIEILSNSEILQLLPEATALKKKLENF